MSSIDPAVLDGSHYPRLYANILYSFAEGSKGDFKYHQWRKLLFDHGETGCEAHRWVQKIIFHEGMI